MKQENQKLVDLDLKIQELLEQENLIIQQILKHENELFTIRKCRNQYQKEKDHIMNQIKQPFEHNLDSPELLDNKSLYKYCRQMILPEIGYNMQKQLLKSKILVVGAGGIGCTALYYLAGSGIGTLGIVDFDNVEDSNLHRQILHDSTKCGMQKTQSAFHTLQKYNELIEIQVYNQKLTQDNVEEIIFQYDIIIDATDNALAKYLLNDACVIQNKPFISAAAIGWEAQISVYNYLNGPCYRCVFPNCTPAYQVYLSQNYLNIFKIKMGSCNSQGVIGIIPGIAGMIQVFQILIIYYKFYQAVESIKIITKQQKILSQDMLIVDILNCNYKKIQLRKKQSNCIVCSEKCNKKIFIKNFDYNNFIGQSCSIYPIIADEFCITWEDLIQQHIDEEKFQYIDVRNQGFYNFYHLKPFKSIPYSKLKYMDEYELEKLISKNKTSIQFNIQKPHILFKAYITCLRGNESRLAVQYLQQHNYYKVINIKGGINQYASLNGINFIKI